MREIKFRGKNKKGSWRYGMLTYANFNQGVEKAIAVKTEFGSILIDKIDENTISQFTGLYDKNGKEIYEGDIVKYKTASQFSHFDELLEARYIGEGIDVIKFNDGSFSPLPHREDCDDYWYAYALFDFEVIGNIYDNPELIKE